MIACRGRASGATRGDGRSAPAAPADRAGAVPARPLLAGHHVRLHLADRGRRAHAVGEGAAHARQEARRDPGVPRDRLGARRGRAARAAARRAGAAAPARRRGRRRRRSREILADAEAGADLARGDPGADRARARGGGARRPCRDDRAAVARSIGSELVTPASRPDVYSTLGRALRRRRARRAQAVALFEGALEELARARARERRGADPLQHLPELRAHRSRRAPAREGRRRGAVRRRRTTSPTGTRRCGSTGRSGGSRSSRRSRSRRSTTSAARSRCSRRPRTRCTSRAPTSRAPTR